MKIIMCTTSIRINADFNFCINHLYNLFNLPNMVWSNDNIIGPISGLSYSSTSIIRVPCVPESFAYF